jgi:hypothetical protein
VAATGRRVWQINPESLFSGWRQLKTDSKVRCFKTRDETGRLSKTMELPKTAVGQNACFFAKKYWASSIYYNRMINACNQSIIMIRDSCSAIYYDKLIPVKFELDSSAELIENSRARFAS